MKVKVKDLTSTVTIINKLKKADSSTNVDIWVKHTLTDCFWNTTSVASQEGVNTNLGEVKQVRIPSNQSITYLPYIDWKQAGNQLEHFTISQNDYIVLGEVEEDITPSNITQIISSYGVNACKIRSFRDLSNKGIETKGFLSKYASLFFVEGV